MAATEEEEREETPASRRTFTVRNAITSARIQTRWSHTGDNTTKRILFAFLVSGKLPVPSRVTIMMEERR